MATQKGGIQHFTVQEAHNINLGQGGSVFLDTDSTVFTPNKGVVIAITMITDCRFDTLTAEDPKKHFGISSLGSPSTTNGTDGDGYEGRGDEISSAATDQIDRGITIFGRWTSVSVANNGECCICYIGN